MNILILGAAGATGRLCVDECLARGHKVGAFVHNSALRNAGERLETVRGDLRTRADIAIALEGRDAVVSTSMQSIDAGSGALDKEVSGLCEPGTCRSPLPIAAASVTFSAVSLRPAVGAVAWLPWIDDASDSPHAMLPAVTYVTCIMEVTSL